MSNALVKEDKSMAVPEYLKSFQGEGAEDVSSDMIEKTFLSMSHEDKGSIKLGDWYDSLTMESFGPEVVVTVCKITRSWRKFNKDLELVASSKDGVNWDNAELVTEDEKWKCAFIDMFVLINERDSVLPLITSFKSTSFKTGRKLATTIAKFTRGNGEPIFARNYTLQTEKVSNKSMTWVVSKYKLNSGFNTEDMVTKASKVRKMVMDIEPVMTDLTDVDPNNDSDFTEEGLD